MGLPTVRIELHAGGTCIFDPPSATVSLRYAVASHTIAVADDAAEIATVADYHDERYWWDELGVDAEVIATPTQVTVSFHDADGMATTSCAHADGEITCG
jgi:hypothetical protein